MYNRKMRSFGWQGSSLPCHPPPLTPLSEYPPILLPLVSIMVKREVTMKFCPMVMCGKITPHSYDDGSKQVECDGACSEFRQEQWRLSVQKSKQPTKPKPRQRVCCQEPHLPFGVDTETAWIDCEAHGNEAPCPCGCGATQCNHVTEEELRSWLWEA